jgi:hypothetical protein
LGPIPNPQSPIPRTVLNIKLTILIVYQIPK